MTGWRERLRDIAGRFRKGGATASAADERGGAVAASLRGLLEDPSIPPHVREAMAADFQRVERMLDRLENEELHVAVFGRVSAGKSALGNALLGRDAFEVGVLHGTTTEADAARLDEAASAGLVLIDTPGINELGGEAREKLAFEVAEVSDLIVFVADGDLTREERDALRTLASTRRPSWSRSTRPTATATTNGKGCSNGFASMPRTWSGGRMSSP